MASTYQQGGREVMNWDWEEWVMGGAVAFIGLLTALYIVVFIADAQEWTQFKIDHHCVEVGEMSGSVTAVPTTSVGSNGSVSFGVGTAYTPGKTGYHCDDDKTYWR
jgi:hypothetical protein